MEKWTMRISPLSFEGKVFPADVSPMWVKMFIEGKGEFKWSVEKHLGAVDLAKPKLPPQRPERRALAGEGYPIEVAHNDELFIVNGKEYEATTYCLGWEQGERVIFIDSSARGVCVRTKLFNIERGEICEVWCK